MPQTTIVIFDFDGTITKSDSFNAFIIFLRGYISFLTFMVVHSPQIALYLLGQLENEKIKERMAVTFFKGMRKTEFDHQALRFSQTELPHLIRSSAIEKIKHHLTQKHEVVIISASLEEWIKPWAKQYGVTNIITSKLKSENGVLTGTFSTNCFGEEKKVAFLKKYPKRSHYRLIMYGDSKGDQPLLTLADEAYYREL